VIVVDVPHHVTQRGNARQVILTSDTDRVIYLDLLRRYTELYQLSLLGYCLMSNHVHLVVVPRKIDALAQTLKHAHGSYASYWNVHHSSSGHVWQGRYYSCPLDWAHLWAALRYTELNPVRAGLVRSARDWKWSSANAHCDGAANELLEMKTWQSRWSDQEWREYLTGEESEPELKSLRQSTHTGRPLGSAEFVEGLEKSMHRYLAPRTAGRRGKPLPDARQATFSFKS
jgi:putative transposase